MRIALKLTFWITLILLFIFADVLHKRFSNQSTISEIKQSISTLDASSKSIFFLGSSRIQRSVNTKLIQDSLSIWKVYNWGLIGNTLAQNLYLANYIYSLPGNKVVFIELSSYLSNYPESFKTALENLDIPDFPNSYFRFMGDKLPQPTKSLGFLKGKEDIFWNKMIQNQNTLKGIFFQDDYNGYNNIGFSPTSRNDVISKESFLNQDDLLVFARSPLDKLVNEKVNQTLKFQSRNSFKIVFLLPVTSNDKVDFKLKIPIFNNIPKDSKWEYDNQFLHDIANPTHLENRNHMNSRGAYVYSQGLVKYIKANESAWK